MMKRVKASAIVRHLLGKSQKKAWRIHDPADKALIGPSNGSHAPPESVACICAYTFDFWCWTTNTTALQRHWATARAYRRLSRLVNPLQDG